MCVLCETTGTLSNSCSPGSSNEKIQIHNNNSLRTNEEDMLFLMDNPSIRKKIYNNLKLQEKGWKIINTIVQIFGVGMFKVLFLKKFIRTVSICSF